MRTGSGHKIVDSGPRVLQRVGGLNWLCELFKAPVGVCAVDTEAEELNDAGTMRSVPIKA